MSLQDRKPFSVNAEDVPLREPLRQWVLRVPTRGLPRGVPGVKEEDVMGTGYIVSKTAQVYKASNGAARETILIFGDEVETDGAVKNGRVEVKFRDKTGHVSKNDVGKKPALEIYFIDVGQGDATFIVTPKRRKILIDGGIDKRAFGFLSWKYRLDQAGPPIDIDLLVLSHADADHIDGLVPIISHPRIKVHKVVHNGIATYNDPALKTGLGDLDAAKKLLITRHDYIGGLAGASLSSSYDAWRNAIVNENTACSAVDSTTGTLDVGDPDVKLSVLGPRLSSYAGKPAYRWFKEEPKTINGHSVVLRLDYDRVSAIFTGDINTEGAKNLMEDGAITSKLTSHIFKAPHHGSHDFHWPLLEAINPQVSVISSGDDPDHGHPRASFLGAVGRASRSAEPLVFSTEIAATFKEVGMPARSIPAGDLRDVDVAQPDSSARARLLFKKVLNGMINVRSDGKDLYAARRVKASYMWESYGPLHASP